MDEAVRVLVLEDVADGETVQGLAAAEDLSVTTAPTPADAIDRLDAEGPTASSPGRARASGRVEPFSRICGRWRPTSR